MARSRSLVHLLFAHCDEMSAVASESFDRDLSRAERFALRLHLLYCSACRRAGGQMRAIRRAMGRLAEDVDAMGRASTVPGLSPADRDRLRRVVEDGLRDPG